MQIPKVVSSSSRLISTFQAYDAQIRVQLNHTHQKLGNEVSQIGRRKKSKLDQAETMSNSPPPAFENGVGSPGGGSASSIDARVSNATNTFKKTFSTTSGKSRFEGIEGYGSGSTSSYPFPQMTATRGAINAMSPSGGGPQDKPLPSGSATPSSFAFMPPGTDPPTPFENSEFPTPNMYELALTLHSEPGLEAFWSNLVKIITNLYKAERVSLAVPTDSTDLENTPWGQKATYCKEEYDTLSLTYIGEGGVGDPETEETEGEDDGQDGVAIPEGNTQSGRSYGTSGMAGKDDSKGYSSAEECNNLSLPLGSSPDLPFSPIVIGMSGTKQKYESSSSDWISEGSNVSPLRSPRSPNGSSEREEDYEQNQVRPSIDDEDQLKGRIFPILQPLSYEADALLDGAGVIRVLQRGKTVVLSREYRDIQSHLERKISAAGREKRRRDMQWSTITQQSDSIRDKGKREQLHIPLNDLPPPSPGRPPSEPPTPLPFVSKGVRRKGKKNGWKNDFVSNPVLQFYSSQQHQQRHSRSHSPSQSLYEEYEQPLSSPWSQSPAPSPAIKPDPSENPFFMPPRVDEDTFNPTSSSPIYSAQEPVHAIGLENASTVIHIPLVHPSISRLFRSNPAQTPSVHETGDRRNQTGKGTSNPSSKKAFTNGFLGSLSQGQANERRSPIAILSILSPVIPYPSNLVHSLSHFAPLVATALALAQAHDHLQTQLTHYRGRNRRRKHSQMNSYIPGHTSMLSPSFRSSSITSPSDHSTISRYSNTASLVTSPNSDAGNLHIHPVSTNSPDTPEQKMGGSGGNVDSYFMAKRRVLPRKQSGLYTPGQGPAHPRHSPSNINAVCNGQPSPSLEVQLQQEEDSGADSGTTIRDRTWEKVTLVSQSTSQGSLPNSDESIAPDDMTKMEQHLGVQGTNALLKTPSPDSESTPRPVSEFGYLRPKRPSLRRKMSLRRSTHTVLHSYGADYTATFQTLAATSTESGAHRPRLGLSSPRPFAMHEMPPPSNKLLRTIIDSIPVHVFTAAPYTGIPVWVNARLLAYQGVTVDEFTRSPWSALHPEDRDEYRRLWKMAVEAGLPFSHQMRIRRFDGVYRWFMNRAVPLRDSKGGIVHWFGTNMDIHDQRLAEVNAARQQEMAESEHKYRSLANSSPQIVFAATADEGITFANTQWQAYSGQTLERTLNLGFMEFVHPHDRYKCSLPGLGEGSHPLPIVSPKAEVKSPGLRAKLEARRLKLSEQGVPDTLSDSTFSTELRLRRKDGEYRWHLVRCVRVESNFGTGEGQWFGTCTDINDHKLLEQRLKETNEAAQKTMESKTRFLANMSHEISQSLHSWPVYNYH